MAVWVKSNFFLWVFITSISISFLFLILGQVNRNMDLIAKFVDCQKMYKESQAARAIEACRGLLKEE